MDLPGHTDEVYCVDFVADKVVSGGRDKVVKMWVSVIAKCPILYLPPNADGNTSIGMFPAYCMIFPSFTNSSICLHEAFIQK